MSAATPPHDRHLGQPITSHVRSRLWAWRQFRVVFTGPSLPVLSLRRPPLQPRARSPTRRGGVCRCTLTVWRASTFAHVLSVGGAARRASCKPFPDACLVEHVPPGARQPAHALALGHSTHAHEAFARLVGEEREGGKPRLHLASGEHAHGARSGVEARQEVVVLGLDLSLLELSQRSECVESDAQALRGARRRRGRERRRIGQRRRGRSSVTRQRRHSRRRASTLARPPTVDR